MKIIIEHTYSFDKKRFLNLKLKFQNLNPRLKLEESSIKEAERFLKQNTGLGENGIKDLAPFLLHSNFRIEE